MYCTYCGTEVDEKARFCPKCRGTSFTNTPIKGVLVQNEGLLDVWDKYMSKPWKDE